MIEHFDGLLKLTSQIIVDGVDGVLHLDNLVFPEIYEIDVVGCLDLEFISGDFALHLLAEVLKYPPYLIGSKIPFKIAENDEIIHPRVFELVVEIQYLIFQLVGKLQE